MENDREGARQPHRFDPRKAALLDDPARLEFLPPGEIFSLLNAPQGGLVVDFGTGTGTFALLLAKERPDLEIVAFDEQPEMLALVEKKLRSEPAPNVRPLAADAKGRESLRGRADRVLAINVLHEIGDAALRDLAALMKPGAGALFVDWNSEVERPVGPPKDHVLSPEEARARLEAAGLSVSGKKLLRFHYALMAPE